MEKSDVETVQTTEVWLVELQREAKRLPGPFGGNCELRIYGSNQLGMENRIH